MNTLDEQIQQLPEIEGQDDIEAARTALASARERLHNLEDRKAEVKAQIPQLRDEVDDLRVEVAQPGADTTDEDLQAAREAVTDAEDELDTLEERQIPSQQQAVERLAERAEDTLDNLGNEFAGQYQSVAIEALRSKAQACRSLADVLGLVDTLDSKRAENRIQNGYGPEIPSVPTLDAEVDPPYQDSLDAETLRNVADELEEQADSLASGE